MGGQLQCVLSGQHWFCGAHAFLAGTRPIPSPIAVRLATFRKKPLRVAGVSMVWSSYMADSFQER
jgi:hypothetical protein